MQSGRPRPDALWKSTRRALGGWDVLSLVAIVVIVAGAVQLVAGGLETGLEEDELTHQDRAVAWLDNGWYVPSYWQEDDEPDPTTRNSTPWVYGPAYQAVAHLVNVAVGNEPWSYAERTAEAYEMRHMVTAALALLTVVAVGAAVWLLTRSRALGLWAAAALLAVPRFLGHSFFSVKDVPVAAGYTLLVVALLFALLREPGEPVRTRRTLGIAAGVSFGILIGAGTRLALWLPFVIALGTYAVLRLAQSRRGGMERDRETDFVIAAAAVLGFVTIAALYPNVSSMPLTLLRESVTGSADFVHIGGTLAAGGLVSVPDPPVWYLPVWIGGTYPLLLGALALFGAGAGIWAIARARGLAWGRIELGLVLVLQQALMLPLATVLNGTTIYNGVRQHLYVLPALTILAGYGAWRLLRWARAKPRGPLWGPAAVGVLCVALLTPMAAQVLLFPFNYTYFNPAVVLTGGVEGRWEADYRWTSLRQAASRVPLESQLRCSPYLRPVLDSELYERGFEVGECSGEGTDVALEGRGTDVAPGALDSPAKMWVLGRNRQGRQPPAYCEEFDNVNRWLWGDTVTMSYVLRCDPGPIAAVERRTEREAEEGE